MGLVADDALDEQKSHALHLQAKQCESLYSSAHHGWHCSSWESSGTVEEHVQKEHCRHLHMEQCSFREQNDSQSAKVESPAMEDVQLPSGAADTEDDAADTRLLDGAPEDVAAAHQPHPLQRHHPQCSLADSGEHQPKQPTVDESSSCVGVHAVGAAPALSGSARRRSGSVRIYYNALFHESAGEMSRAWPRSSNLERRACICCGFGLWPLSRWPA